MRLDSTPGKRRFYAACLLSIFYLGSPQGWAQVAEQAGYELAFTPFLPVRTMMQNYQPLRDFLELRLKEPVALVTAVDYKSYNERLRRHTYSFVITEANSAYLAYADYGYIPMLRPINYSHPTLVVAQASKLTHMRELRGQTVTLSDALAMISMQALPMLREAGLEPQRDVTLKYVQNHSAAANYVLSGEAAAAIISDRALAQMPEATRAALRVVQVWEAGAAPGVFYLASPALPKARVEKMQHAILEFVHNTEPGREMMRRLGYQGLIMAQDEDFKPLAPYGAQLRKALEASP